VSPRVLADAGQITEQGGDVLQVVDRRPREASESRVRATAHSDADGRLTRGIWTLADADNRGSAKAIRER
jgi:hypothetical protein